MNMDMGYTSAHIILYKRFCTNVVINAPTAGLKFVESEGKVIQDERIAESMTSKLHGCGPEDRQQHLPLHLVGS